NPQPETGQMDGGPGALLLGDGAGNFDQLLPTASGISVPGQGMALTVADFNEDALPDLLMSVNDGHSRAWINQASTHGKQPLVVRLNAGTGNPNGVGSRLKVITQQGVQTHEVTAGSGYLSQSSPQIFMLNDPDNPIVRLEISWPDGTQQDYPFDEDLKSPLVIEKQTAVSTQ
ncbi:MAG: CRTAC1 family protein, partial [Planctomycetaceae bacterium]|nr:CRTAC1 family protein [Planctomycetaceae bacterium]